ncbi:hypothetical protein O6H91_04G007200 [Diphasiastrum complanatum]|uniref:Uncharacterized protein n=2 Tax=Diphasiastrum complanatum TaxID=34168 RepID=A0ACC2DUB5_DIPCM|nr:hypothetical protein O6H91_04G006800 [Diphasiastrum complanatum]KAJ7557729.1 hypothetical protein O6H91_04G007200 [Diphasiastrum complanatum]
MRIRKGFVAADGQPVSMTYQHTTFLNLQHTAASPCVQECPDKGSMGTESFSNSIVDPDKMQCIAMGLNRTTANRSGKALWGTREHRKEDKGAYGSKGRCIMCGETGHSCLQQLANMSHAALSVKYCFSKSGVLPMLQKVENVERGKRGHSYCNIHDDHPDQIPRSCGKKEPSGKPSTTTTKKRPYTHVHNDYGVPGRMNGNEFERKERKDSTVAGKQTQRIKAPNKIQSKFHASNERCDLESPNVSPSSGKDRVMLKDSALQSCMTQCVAGTKLDLGNGKAVLQKFLNRQGHCDQVLDVSNASENLSAIKSSTIQAKVDRQCNPVLTPASLYNEDAVDEGHRTKWSADCNLESTDVVQEPAGTHDPGYRCKRMDGKGWQCLRKAEAGFSLCEYHLSKFRANHIRKKAAKIAKDAMPFEKELSGRKKSKNKFLGTTVAEGVVADPLPQEFQRQRKPVKARSIMSIQ